MATSAVPPAVLLVFLAAATFLAMTVWLMLGPLLVELAAVFHTSVAVTGQLTAATAITWGLTAFLAGPLSDIYGRRRMLLTGLMLTVLGTLCAAFAWNFRALLAFRCLTGVGAAMIIPNCLATVADVFPPSQRGKAMGWVISATGLGTAFGVPLVALLTEMGGWRVPFYAIGALLFVLWALLWVWFPTSQAGSSGSFLAHVQAVSGQSALWCVLAVNGLQVMAFMGMSSYLAAYLMHTYRLSARATALPLTVAGCGVIAGSLVGGRVAGQACRVTVVALAFMGGGFGAALVFTTDLSPWVTVLLAFGVGGLLPLSWPLTAVLLTELAGQSRATATGLFAVSNQLGVVGGASLGGVMLALGNFPWVGIFCLVTAVLAAGVILAKGPGAVASPMPLSPSSGASGP
jgi:MFS transporter, DHA1 family, inner membrane transport protein